MFNYFLLFVVLSAVLKMFCFKLAIANRNTKNDFLTVIEITYNAGKDVFNSHWIKFITEVVICY